MDPLATTSRKHGRGEVEADHGRPRKARKKNEQEVQPGHNTTNLNSLYDSNIGFSDSTKKTKKTPNEREHRKSNFEATNRRAIALDQLFKDAGNIKDITREQFENAFEKLLGKNSKLIKSVPDKDGDCMWLLHGMRSPLKHYQVLGASFMRVRELGEEEPWGGIQADAPGLGSEDTLSETTLMLLIDFQKRSWCWQPSLLAKGMIKNLHGSSDLMILRQQNEGFLWMVRH